MFEFFYNNRDCLYSGFNLRKFRCDRLEEDFNELLLEFLTEFLIEFFIEFPFEFLIEFLAELISLLI